MPSLRYTDGSPVARECTSCHATHRDDLPCPPVNVWIIARTPVPGPPRTPVHDATSLVTMPDREESRA